jgi:hypothetical protein
MKAEQELKKSEVGSRKTFVQFCNGEKFVGTVSVHKTSEDKDKQPKTCCLIEALDLNLPYSPLGMKTAQPTHQKFVNYKLRYYQKAEIGILQSISQI